MKRPTPYGFDRNVLLLGATSLLNDVSSEIIYPLLPTFLTAVLGAGPAALGLIEGVADSTSSVLKLVSGRLSDRLHARKGLATAGYAVAAVARPFVALAAAPWHVLLIRFADRTGKGLRSAPRDALLAASSTPAARGRAFGLHRAMDHLGAVIGPLLAFVLMQAFAEGYRTIFALASVPGLFAVGLIATGVREVPAASASRTAAVPARPLPPRWWLFLAALFVFTLGNSTDAFLLLRAQTLGVPAAHLPLLWVVLHAVKSASSVPSGALSDRIGRRRVILIGWLIYAAVYLGFAAAGTPAAVWALFAAYGLFFGLTESAEKALVADLFAPESRGGAFGIYHLTIGIAALPASVLFGVAWDWYGAAWAFRFGAALASVAAVLLVSAAPQRRAA